MGGNRFYFRASNNRSRRSEYWSIRAFTDGSVGRELQIEMAASRAEIAVDTSLRLSVSVSLAFIELKDELQVRWLVAREGLRLPSAESSLTPLQGVFYVSFKLFEGRLNLFVFRVGVGKILEVINFLIELAQKPTDLAVVQDDDSFRHFGRSVM